MGEKCFTTALNTSCRGDFSFKTLVFPCPVCGIFRLARSDGGREREIVRPAHEKWPKIGCLWRAERILSRVEWGRGRAGRILSRLPARYYQRPWLGHRPRPATVPGTVPGPTLPRPRHRLPAPPPYFAVPRHPPHRRRWGFCSIRSWLPACRRRVGVLMTSFPHVAAVRSRFEAKVQTHWVKNAENGVLWAGGLCFGHNGTWNGLLCACGPLNMRVVPLIRT